MRVNGRGNGIQRTIYAPSRQIWRSREQKIARVVAGERKRIR
jgi:hypothetical protein